MSVTRANVEAAKGLIVPRLGDPYVYGGALSADPRQGTDCSGVWDVVLSWVLGRQVFGRPAEGATTESYRYIPVGGVGPYGTIRVGRPQDIPADAVVKLAFHHEGSGGASSHMWGILDGMRIESAGSKGLVTQPAAWDITNQYANAWAYLPGPIVEDGTAVTGPPEPADTLFADVSEFQVPVNDSYPYAVLSIRSNDGTHRDLNFAQNYAWMRRALDTGRLRMGIVYFYWRPNWQDAIATHQAMINAGGGPHPRIVSMIDVERGGNPAGDFSDALNTTDAQLSDWLGDPRRVIAYGNTGDLNGMWPNRREDQFIIAGYGSNPSYPGKIAHQYTDGNGYGGGLPEGCDPFGNCDMNSADGYTATALAAACGITTTPPPPTQPAGDITMADAQSIINQAGGVAQNGDPLPWRLVHARAERNIGDIVNDAERGPWESDHNGTHYPGTFDADEQLVTVAEQIAWVHTFSDGVERDSGDVLIALGEFLVTQGVFTK